MSLSRLPRRTTLALLTMIAALAGLLPSLPAQAQETPIKFQLDWGFEGPSALFLLPAAKGLFKAEKLNELFSLLEVRITGWAHRGSQAR